MADSSIEWTDKVWNVTRGCSRVSPGCGGGLGDPLAGGCYAERQAARFSGPGQPYEGLVRIGKQGPRWTGKMMLATHKLTDPFGWTSPKRIFVNSMSDLMHEGLTREQIASVFGVMAATSRHTYQVLTKRAARMRELMSSLSLEECWVAALKATCKEDGTHHRMVLYQRPKSWPLPNVHLGVSVEDQKRADERIPDLLATPAVVRFLSVEPLLGPVELAEPGALDWVIVGSESGPGARPMDIDWARSVVNQCVDAGVAVFTKQIATDVGRLAGNRKGGDPKHWPVGNWPRQFPQIRATP